MPSLSSYTFDSFSKSQELSSAIQSANNPSQIASACASIDSFVHSHSPDQSRHFFSLAFPTLISKLFGLDDPAFANAWIHHRHSDDLAQTLFSLLSRRRCHRPPLPRQMRLPHQMPPSLDPFLSPLSSVPLVSLVGFGLYELGFPGMLLLG
ncbi:unnamed protein product [Sphenostylis stenocarpa]|uniref:Uncharacterized protein n=1 Tax=Sphenostylis stenocarpa TaxID=92480 RepID=A0AA86VSX7_9FABA|nr:unnamed protein product [Sphenostylis stenocarpa]